MLVKPISGPEVFEADNAGTPVGHLPVPVTLSHVELAATCRQSDRSD
jgi:hypothetical protein